MNSNLRFAICDFKRRETLCIAAMALATVIGLVGGCITHPQNPSATQPATEIDPATTQPYYWLAKPAAAQVQAKDFETIWDTCKTTARDYQFALDREDFRAGVISTVPLVSKQWFEPWRPDTGTANDVLANSMGAIRRTLRFEIARNADETFTITPKVLVEREVILERNVTDVSQYRFAFSGPATKIPAREAVTLDPDTFPNVPIKYWYPTGRDTQMEIQAADRLRQALTKREALAGPGTGAPTNIAGGTPFVAGGVISAIGENNTFIINLGVTDKIVPGMTFEVYEDRATLPTLAGYTLENPQSKGWIEVVSVGNGSSTCKMLKPMGLTAPKPGDQIFNFIFRRGKQNHFVVAGDFTGDRETIAGLIWRWNGIVDARISPQADYLILGTPPTQAAPREAYDGIKSQAEQLKIPILSEERFNILVRYYDPIKR